MTAEWHAQVVDSLDAFVRDHVEFAIWRHIGQQIEYITNIGEHGTIAKKLEEGFQMPDDGRLFLPRGALTALADHLKPGPTTGELGRLEDALALERSRVDNVLATLLAKDSHP